MSDYIVVFRHTKSAGAYAGIVVWTSFESKADFDTRMKEPLRHQEVIAEGVSEEEAINLTRKTPLKCRIAVALAKSTHPDTGETDEEILRHEMMSVMMLIR